MNEPVPTLYRVVVNVRPTALHPLYWDVQYGFLVVLLFAANDQEAADRSSDIAEAAQFEPASPSAIVAQYERDSDPELRLAEEQARTIGIGLYLRCTRTGTDEFPAFSE